MGCAFFTLLAVFVVVIGSLVAVGWFWGKKLVLHLRQQPDALPVLVEHLVRPLLASGEVAKPEAKKTKGFVV